MKKKYLISALVASTLFLSTLTSCDSNGITKSTIEKTNSTITTTNTSSEEKLYEKVLNEFKKTFNDITKNNLEMVEYEDEIDFYFKSSYIKLDLNGEFIEKSISIEESNIIKKTLSNYINNEWVVEQIVNCINEKDYVIYQLGYDELLNLYYKLEYTYDDNGNELTEIQSILKNDSWVYEIKTEYAYDANGNMTNSKEFAYHNNEWIKIEENIKYGNDLKLVYSLVLKEDGTYYSKTERTYDDNGKQLTFTYSRFINNEWVIENKTNTIKNREYVVLDLKYNEDGSFNLKYEYEYDDNGELLSRKESKYINNEWKIINGKTYNDGILRYSYEISLNEDGSFDSKRECTYIKNILRDKEIVSKYIDNEWVKIEEYKWFDLGKSTTARIVFMYDLDNNKKYESTWDTLDDNICLITRKTYECINQIWFKSEEYIYVIDEDGSKYSMDYIYDLNGNTLSEAKTSYKDGKWGLEYKNEYTYEDNKKVTKTTSYYTNDKLTESKTYFIDDDAETLQYSIFYNEDGSYKTKNEYSYDNYYENSQYVVTRYIYANDEWKDIDKFVFYNGLGLPIYRTTTNNDGSYQSKVSYTYDNNHNKLSEIYCNYKNNQWIFDNKNEYAYDEDGNLSKRTISKYIDNEWVKMHEYAYINSIEKEIYFVSEPPIGKYSYKIENTYDENGNILLCIWEEYIDGEWVLYEKTEYTHDEYESVAIGYRFKDGEWVLDDKREITYNENGKLLTYITYDYHKNNDTWTYHMKQEYDYDTNGNILSHTYYNYEDSQWVAYCIYEYTYDENGNLLISFNINSAYENGYKYEYTYDENGNKLSEVKSDYKKEQWVYSYKYEYKYDENGNKLIEVKSDYKEEQWVYSYKYEYKYDENGNKLSETYYKYEDSQWVYSYKYEYTYDENGNKLSETKSNYKEEQWVYDYKYEYTYDENGNQLKKEYFTWSNYSDDWNKPEIYEYTYDENNRILCETKYKRYFGWVIDYKYEYLYDDNGIKYTKIDGEWVLQK